jgi:hypothetical protein
MAHGSKKWIVDATGRLKKSKDRTKKDYYREIEMWDEWYNPHGWWSRLLQDFVKTDKSQFCPQCKHVQKPIVAEDKARMLENERLHDEYNRIHGDAARQWQEYRSNVWKWVDVDYKNRIHWKTLAPVRKPTVEEPPRYYKWIREQDHASCWIYARRSYFCFKHERWYDIKQELWDIPMPGKKARYGGRVKDCRRQFRKNWKNEMQRAKYVADFEGYDNISPYRREWID